MNLKLLFPTYRTRYLFVEHQLQRFRGETAWPAALHIGSGEGDYDPMIASSCQTLISCDVHAQDVQFAQGQRPDRHVHYSLHDALRLGLSDACFSLVVAVDVLEHVRDPQQMLAEVERVLVPGGIAIITFPQQEFPATYDPLHRWVGRKWLPLGAYAYGHDQLIDRKQFLQWVSGLGLEVMHSQPLSGAAVGLVEMYWPGILQRFLKPNARNQAQATTSRAVLRPSQGQPKGVAITDGLIRLDQRLQGRSTRSVGYGFVLRKPLSA